MATCAVAQFLLEKNVSAKTRWAGYNNRGPHQVPLVSPAQLEEA